MTAGLLAIHVLAAVVFVGPTTVAASTFPRYVRAAVADPSQPAAATDSTAREPGRTCPVRTRR